MKTFMMDIKNDDYIVRDHRVHGVRIMPGVTFIDIFLRILVGENIPIDRVEFSNIVFSEPIATTEAYDKRVCIELTEDGDDCEIVGRSQKIRGDVALESAWSENVRCKVTFNKEKVDKKIDLKRMKDNAIKVVSLEEMYARVRHLMITHYEFMKGLGDVYIGDGYLLAEVHLSDLAKDYLDYFFVHPAYLDCSTLVPLVHHIITMGKSLDKPYIPLFIERFRATGKLDELCYVYMEPDGVASEADDILYNNLELYDASGNLAASFTKLAAKRIRSQELITKLRTTQGVAIADEIEQTRTITHGDHNKSIEHSPEYARSSDLSAREIIENNLQNTVAKLLDKDVSEIKIDVGFYDLGLDSTQLLKIVRDVEEKLGEQLYPTLLFEYTNIRDLAAYFDTEYGQRYLSKVCSSDVFKKARPDSSAGKIHADVDTRAHESLRDISSYRKNIHAISADDAVAIVGLSGRYPKADDLRKFWVNILHGMDCITEIPEDHWDYHGYYDGGTPGAGRLLSKWGGFVDDVDKFDPLFFKISPRDAEIMDPQLRLLLEGAWEVIEDAGYTPRSLMSKVVGVYVGVMNDDFTWVASESYYRTGKFISPGSYAHDLANRISYFMNFNGPSLAVETACSSSLTAVHMARKAILSGECEMAIAGGVNLNVHRSKYLMLSSLGIISPKGQERAFDAAADGYVPGEGIGLVFLKSLEAAIADNDHIYAVIRGSAINHSGSGAGRFVPNVNELSAAADKALIESGIDPERIEYIETHGTGTPLGDPVELKALANTISSYTRKRGYCALGSKSNLGHMESASGICSLTKVLLSMQYGMIPKCPNVTDVNPSIPLDTYPFYIPYESVVWKAGELPRVACINSFGVGGSNCFMVVEEYRAEQRREARVESAERLIVVSAKTKDQLKEYACKLVDLLEQDEKQVAVAQTISSPDAVNKEPLNLEDMAYTLQVGREVFEERLAVVTAGLPELKIKLMDYINGKRDIDGVHFGNIKEVKDRNGLIEANDDGKQYIKELFTKHQLNKIAAFWVNGSDMDWEALYQEVAYRPRRISLPTYPFKRDRYWIHDEAAVVEKNRERHRDLFANTQAKKVTPSIEGSLVLAEYWGEVELTGKVEPLMGAVLVLTNDEFVCGELRKIAGKKCRIIQVRKGNGYKELSDGIYQVSPEKVGDYNKLLDGLKGKDIHADKVIYLWDDEAFGGELEELGRGLESGISSLFGVTRAIMDGRPRKDIKMLYITEAEGVNPFIGGLSGFMRSANLENPKFKYKIISASCADISGIIVKELERWGPAGVAELKYENHKRYGRMFRDLEEQREKKSALKEHGVYVLTGAVGGLGLLFAKYLSKQYKAKLVLSDMRDQDANVEKQLQEISELGGEAIYAKCDVVKRNEVMRLLSTARESFGRINGIVHAAGILRDALIIKKTREEIEAVIRPKVYGAINLDEASQDDDLDMFVLFSSLAGVMGNVGQADYAFGNRFMDHFAKWRQDLAVKGKRKGKAISIDWPLWKDGGMMVDDEVKRWMKQSGGMTVMPTAEGLKAFEIGLGSGLEHVSVFHGDERRIRELLGTEVLHRIDENSKSSGVMKKKDVVETLDNLCQDITGLVTDILKIKKEDVDIDADISEYGFDSITITELMSKLNSMFDIELTPSALVENRSIGAMARYLINTYKDRFSIYEQVHGGMESEKLKQGTSEEKLSSDMARIINFYSISSTELNDLYGEEVQETDKSPNISLSLLNRMLKNYSETAHVLVPSVDGVKIDVLVSGHGEPILFIPPWGMTSNIWTLQIREWAATNRVIGINLPGHGLSDMCGDYSIENLGRILIEVIEKMDIASPMHMVGASYGGVIAQVIANKLRDRIASLTLVNSLCKTATGEADVIIKGDGRTISRDARSIMLYLNERSVEDFNTAISAAKMKKGECRKEDLEALFIKSSVLDPVAALKYAETLFSYDTSDLIAGLDIPAFVVVGENDIVINSIQSEMINAILPRSRIVAVKGGGHHCFLTHYRKFNELVYEFMHRHRSAKKKMMNGLKKKVSKKRRIPTKKTDGHIRFNIQR